MTEIVTFLLFVGAVSVVAERVAAIRDMGDVQAQPGEDEPRDSFIRWGRHYRTRLWQTVGWRKYLVCTPSAMEALERRIWDATGRLIIRKAKKEKLYGR